MPNQNLEPNPAFYRQDLEQRKNWYRQFANAYHKTRPRYPKSLIRRVVEVAQLPLSWREAPTILELGCGPGTATIEFAELGFSIVCVEPSPEACQLAQQTCAQYPKVLIQNTSFEEWELEPERFDAVLAASSFHWISPDIACSKSAAALKANGALILLWNFPQTAYAVHQASIEVYQTHAPSLAKYDDRETHEAHLRTFGQKVLDSGQFKNLVSEQTVFHLTYSIDDYLILLSTLSPYIALEPSTRSALFQDLKKVLSKNFNTGIDVTCISTFQIAEKR